MDLSNPIYLAMRPLSLCIRPCLALFPFYPAQKDWHLFILDSYIIQRSHFSTEILVAGHTEPGEPKTNCSIQGSFDILFILNCVNKYLYFLNFVASQMMPNNLGHNEYILKIGRGYIISY